MLIMEYLSEGDLHNHLMNYRYVEYNYTTSWHTTHVWNL